MQVRGSSRERSVRLEARAAHRVCIPGAIVRYTSAPFSSEFSALAAGPTLCLALPPLVALNRATALGAAAISVGCSHGAVGIKCFDGGATGVAHVLGLCVPTAALFSLFGVVRRRGLG